jgi:LPXTG-motif cell wall-anchored protein
LHSQSGGGLRARALFLATAGVALVLLSAGPAHAQVGYDPSKTVEPLCNDTADGTGFATCTATLPDDVTAGFEVIAAGTGADGLPRSVFADVSGGSALGAPRQLETAAGSHTIVLASHSIVAGPGGSVVTVSATGFKANSLVKFSVRFTPEAASNGGPVTSGGALPLTGSNIGFLLAVAAAVLLVGSALVTSTRNRRSA